LTKPPVDMLFKKEESLKSIQTAVCRHDRINFHFIILSEISLRSYTVCSVRSSFIFPINVNLFSTGFKFQCPTFIHGEIHNFLPLKQKVAVEKNMFMKLLFE